MTINTILNSHLFQTNKFNGKIILQVHFNEDSSKNIQAVGFKPITFQVKPSEQSLSHKDLHQSNQSLCP